MRTNLRRIGFAAALACGCGGDDGNGEAGSSGASDSDATDGTSGSDTMGSGATGTSTDSGSATTGTGTATAGTGTTGGTGGTSGGTTGGVDPSDACPALPPPQGASVTVSPSDADDLPNIVGNAASGTTILFEDGTYDLSGTTLIHITTPGVTVRSSSGDRDAVVLDAGYGPGEIFLVAASDFTIADMTVQRALWHPIHVTGGASANTENTLIYNVRVIDPGQQAIKINASSEGYYSDNGEVACSRVEMTDAGRQQVSDCYTGGIDAHSAWGWVVRDNHFEGFWCDEGLSEHAVHFWVTGRDTVVERNVIRDCARGVGFGLGASGNGNERVYADDPCPSADYLGHVDGVIRNNFVWAGRMELFASASGFDSGVALEQACGATVVHNTVVSLQPPFVSMEYRFPNTDALIQNNLVSHAIVQRDGGQATLAGNMENAATSHFDDAASGDLHLDAGSSAIDAGAALNPPLQSDVDGDPRDDGMPDVGADERTP